MILLISHLLARPALGEGALWYYLHSVSSLSIHAGHLIAMRESTLLNETKHGEGSRGGGGAYYRPFHGEEPSMPKQVPSVKNARIRSELITTVFCCNSSEDNGREGEDRAWAASIIYSVHVYGFYPRFQLWATPLHRTVSKANGSCRTGIHVYTRTVCVSTQNEGVDDFLQITYCEFSIYCNRHIGGAERLPRWVTSI